MDYIEVSFMVAILYYSYIKCYPWAKLGEGHKGVSIYYFLQLHEIPQLSKNEKLKK